jgi:hypothetical protein
MTTLLLYNFCPLCSWWCPHINMSPKSCLTVLIQLSFPWETDVYSLKCSILQFLLFSIFENIFIYIQLCLKFDQKYLAIFWYWYLYVFYDLVFSILQEGWIFYSSCFHLFVISLSVSKLHRHATMYALPSLHTMLKSIHIK